MTATRAPTMTLADVKRRQRDPNPDPVQVRLDRDYLVGLVDRKDEHIAALRSALLELSQLAEEAGFSLRGVAKVARGVARDKSLDGGS